LASPSGKNDARHVTLNASVDVIHSGVQETVAVTNQHASIPRWVGSYAERVVAARGRPSNLKRLFARCAVPMILIDDERRYLDANTSACLAFRLSVSELRTLRVDELTPEYFLPTLAEAWARLKESGCVAGHYDVASPADTRLEVVYYALADSLPGEHLVVFAPVGWSEDDFASHGGADDDGEIGSLTHRELEVLELAADGHTGPMIADELVLSTATVRTHFANIYDKLKVGDRAAAVAKAMRLGLIV
jgi:DNA-binding CsgD family transcriptional regulator